MKKIIFILVIISFWGAIFSQNAHFQYRVTGNPTLKSAVTIVHSSGRAYLIQTESDKLHISRINPTNMQPLGNTSSHNIGIFNTIHLNGGYEDLQGNLITYGYGLSGSSKSYLIVKIDVNSMSVRYAYGEGVEIIEGCWGKDVNGAMYNLFLLNKINDQNEVIAYNDNLTPCNTISFNSRFGIITDISWDPYHDLFIASGSTSINHIDAFLIYFTCDILNPDFFHLVDTLRISIQYFLKGAECRTLHEVIDDRHLIIIHGLNDVLIDYFWAIQVENIPLNLSVLNSRVYTYPQHKLTLQDMKYNPYNNKLTILGRNVLCEKGVNFIAQMDPYTLADIDIAEIMDRDSNSSCIISHPLEPVDTAYGNKIYLKKLELNPFNSCHTVLSTGINEMSPWGTSPYITETYNIAYSGCDKLSNTYGCYIPFTNPPSPPEVYSNFTHLGTDITTQTSSLSLHQNVDCNDTAFCGKGSLKPNIDNQLTKPTPGISLYSCDYFKCSHFSETVYYYLYDLAGKVLFQGITENDIKTLLPNFSNGIYILSVVDKVGNKKSEKVIYLK